MPYPLHHRATYSYSIERFVPSCDCQSLVVAAALPVLLGLDYGNATLAGLPASPFLTPRLGRSLVFVDWITSPTLLPVFTGCQHQSASSLDWVLHDTAPRYLSDLLHNVTDLPARSRLRSSTSRLLDVRPSRLYSLQVNVRFWRTLPSPVRLSVVCL